MSIAFYRIGAEASAESNRLAPVETGDLRRSINFRSTGDSATFGTNKVYARIHDLGGVILPKTKRMLSWKKGGKWHFAHKVTIKKANGIGYLTPTYNKMTGGRAIEIFREEFLRENA